MELRTVLFLCLSVWEVYGKADHAELKGEHPKEEDVDNGECIPIYCVNGAPPRMCKKLCDLRSYETICEPPGDFCLCRHWVNGERKLVSPDEVTTEPRDSSEVIDQSSDKSKVADQEPSSTSSEDGVVSFHIMAIFLPIKQFLYDSSVDVDPTQEPTVDPLTLGYETVNVHEGRLFWDFRYILTGLLLLMVGLVVYELVLCATQVYRSRREISVKCEEPEVKVKAAFLGNEKIINV